VSHNLPQELDQQVADHSLVPAVDQQHQQMQTHLLQHQQTHQPQLRRKTFQPALAPCAETEMAQMTREFQAKLLVLAAPQPPDPSPLVARRQAPMEQRLREQLRRPTREIAAPKKMTPQTLAQRFKISSA
jgi:hypothetical protein